MPETSPEKMGEEGGRKVEVVHTRKATVDRGKGQEQGSGLLRRTAAIPQEFSEGSLGKYTKKMLGRLWN